MTNAEAIVFLEKTSAALGEHFDAVQIIASWTEDGSTSILHCGAGNVYTRLGMLMELQKTWDAQTLSYELKQVDGEG